MGYLCMYGATNDNAFMVMEAYVRKSHADSKKYHKYDQPIHLLLVFVTFCNISTYFPLISWNFYIMQL